MAFVNNYSTSFRYLDFLFGTDNKYRAYKARLAAQGSKDTSHKANGGRPAESNTSGEWKKQVESEVEREGVRAEAEAEQGGWGREANVGWAWWSRKDKKE